jgi:hypothetical protein
VGRQVIEEEFNTEKRATVILWILFLLTMPLNDDFFTAVMTLE